MSKENMDNQEEKKKVSPKIEAKIELASNGSTPAAQLAYLAGDNNPNVRSTVAKNPNTQDNVLITLTQDPNIFVRHTAYGSLGIRGKLHFEETTQTGTQIGSGGFATVHKIRTPSGETIAKKFFKFLGQPENRELALKRFLHGARIMRDVLDHPHIVKVYEIFNEDTENSSFTMEYVPGVDLSKLVLQPEESAQTLGYDLGNASKIPTKEIIHILLDICYALEAAHADSVVHRDVKPKNILVYHEGTRLGAKLCDFDLAYLPMVAQMTLSISNIFNTAFSPPWLSGNEEEFKANISINDARAMLVDDYSFAATIFFVFTTRPPHNKRYIEQLLREALDRFSGTIDEKPFEMLQALIQESLDVVKPEDMRVTINQYKEALKQYLKMQENPEKIKGIMCFSSPKDTPLLRCDLEHKAIKDNTNNTDSYINFLSVETASKPFDLQRSLTANREFNLLHFGGHGQGEVYFDDEKGNKFPVTGATLGTLLKNFVPPSGQLKCVILNACETSKMSDFLAKDIKVPFVIGMKGEFADEAAIAFVTGFYDALSKGYGYEKSFDFGCSAVSIQGFLIEPVIFKAKRYLPTKKNKKALLVLFLKIKKKLQNGGRKRLENS